MLKLKRYIFALVIFIITACSNQNEFRFGPNPADDMHKNQAILKQLPDSDAALLNKYITYQAQHKPNYKPHPATGKTLKQVMQDAQAWQQSSGIDGEEDQQAFLALAEKSKRDFLRNKISETVAVNFVKRILLPPNPAAGRNDAVIQLEYKVINRGYKSISSLKGKAVYTGEFGDVIVEHPFDSSKMVPPNGYALVIAGYLVSPVWPQMSKLAGTPEGKFSFNFVPEALVLDDGETLVVPTDPRKLRK